MKYFSEQMKKIEEEEKKKAEENLDELKNDIERVETNTVSNNVTNAAHNAASKTQESPGVSSRGPHSQPMSASLDGDKNREKLGDEKSMLKYL